MPMKPSTHGTAPRTGACPPHGTAASIRLPHTLPPMMKEKEVCDLLGIAAGTLRNWRVSGRGPRFCKLTGSVVRYPTQFLEEWLNARSRHSTSEAAQ